MGAFAGSAIDAWLRQGGLVVTASERAARAIALAFHRARRADGLKAWTTPNIQDWNAFIRAQWAARFPDGRLLLNRTQEQAIWADIVSSHDRLSTLLEGPRFRLAALAVNAHELLCSYAPRYLRASARAGWQNDAAAFSHWVEAFDETCQSTKTLSAARLPIELLQRLGNSTQRQDGEPARPPILLAGFDRLLPLQRALFDAWGEYQEADAGKPAAHIEFHHAPHEHAELDACALWCGSQWAANPDARILVVTQDAAGRRGEIERAFLHHIGRSDSLPFEFSLGIPLAQVTLPRAAFLLLRWLSEPLAEHELDWLFSTGFATADVRESSALQVQMRSIRRKGLQQPEWTIRQFLSSVLSKPEPNPPLASWVQRMLETQTQLDELARRPHPPLDWAERIPRMLESLKFASAQPLSSSEYQANDRLQQALESVASLGFDGRRIGWKDFLSALSRALEETLFVPESHHAPILIAGPAESAGLAADAIWFLGATEDEWPARGATHPLLPLDVQREAQMPHATPQLDWDLAQAISTRLLSAAPQIHFSFSRQMEGTEKRPSRIIELLVGPPKPLTPELVASPPPRPLTIPVEDSAQIPFLPGKVHGGASVLTFQSQCPFKAFATARLSAESWEPAQTGLSPSQRGQLLHAVLHAVWAGPQDGIRSHEDLLVIPDRTAFVSARVRKVFASDLPASLRDRMPDRYLDAEQRRLTRLVTEWLDYEAARVPFHVLRTEEKRSLTVDGLNFEVRLDRLDRLQDQSVLVIDYKSGDVSAKSWQLPRPDDVQLPLYAAFGLEPGQELGGLVFARLRPGDQCFAGHVGNATATLRTDLNSRSSLVSNPFTAEMKLDWQDCIRQLARDFLDGRAEVDPRDPPATCERCGLQTICRIQESQVIIDPDEPSKPVEARDE